MTRYLPPFRPATALLLSAATATFALGSVTAHADMASTRPAAVSGGMDDPLLLLGTPDGLLAPLFMEDGSVSLGADDGEFGTPGGGDGGSDSSGGGGEEGGGDGGGEEGGGDGGEMEYGPEDVRSGSDSSVPTATAPAVNAAVVLLAEVNETCALYNQAETLDCIRDEYQRIAKSIPSSQDYAEMKAALNSAVAELDTIVRANIDTTVRPVRKRAGNRTSATPIRRIAPARVASANAQAAVVLDTLSTRLLRSASSGGAQQVRYERAAQAVAGATVLLRST